MGNRIDGRNSLWTEKYRPTSLEEGYVFPTQQLQSQYEKWKEDGIFPNVMLKGEPGTGKSTLAGMLIKEFGIQNIDILYLDGSRENTLDVLRNRIEPFTKMTPSKSPFKVVLIEESHRLSGDVQSALFEIVEKRTHVRFIFTTNYVNKFKKPLLSRFRVFDFSEHDDTTMLEYLLGIIEAEGYTLESDEDLDALEAHYHAHKPDMRATIFSIQDHISKDGLAMPESSGVSSASLEDWEKEWVADDVDIAAVLDLTSTVDENNFDDFYRVIYENAHRHFPAECLEYIYPELSEHLFRAQNTTGGVGFQPLHLTALIYRIINIVSEVEADGE